MQLNTVEQNQIAKHAINLIFKVDFMKSLLLKRHFQLCFNRHNWKNLDYVGEYSNVDNEHDLVLTQNLGISSAYAFKPHIEYSCYQPCLTY